MADLAWPAIPAGKGNIILSLLFQLEQSQWWTPEKLRAQRHHQAVELLRHARDSVPFYRGRLKDIKAARRSRRIWSQAACTPANCVIYGR